MISILDGTGLRALFDRLLGRGSNADDEPAQKPQLTQEEHDYSDMKQDAVDEKTERLEQGADDPDRYGNV